MPTTALPRPEGPTGPGNEAGTALMPPVSALGGLRQWGRRQWIAAGVAALATALVLGLPTDVIPNPIFGRPVDVTWWSPLVLAITAVLGGMVAATYVRPSGSAASTRSGDAQVAAVDGDRPGRLAGIGGVLGFVAIGCPVCNKLVVLALGTTGALNWFAPLQPVLAVAAVVALAVALRVRLRGQVACTVARS